MKDDFLSNQTQTQSYCNLLISGKFEETLEKICKHSFPQRHFANMLRKLEVSSESIYRGYNTRMLGEATRLA